MMFQASQPLTGWSGGAMMLGNLTVPGRPTALEVGAGWC